MKRITEKTLHKLAKDVYNGREDILQGYNYKQLTKLKNQLEGPQINRYSSCIIEINLPGYTQESRYNEVLEDAGTILKNLIVAEIRNQKIKQLEL